MSGCVCVCMCVCVCVCVCVQDYNDEIRQAQLQELTFLNGGSEDAKVPDWFAILLLRADWLVLGTASDALLAVVLLCAA